MATPAELIKENPKNVEEKEMFIRKFEMEGHTYIYFIEEGDSGLRQVVHDPNCKCQKNKKEEKK
jgi:hypothetical protein